jgi:GTP-binding protein
MDEITRSGGGSGRTSSEDEVRYLKIAVVGRPNVGKSSFINNILKTDRVIVSHLPGTTRDSIDTHFNYEGDEYILIDTAGMRHKRKVRQAVDVYSMMRSAESIRRADVVMLLIDASEGFAKDDLGILDLIDNSGKACIILVNKWDLSENVEDVSSSEYKKHMESEVSRIGKYPVFFVSSKTGKNVLESLSKAKALDNQLDNKISTPQLNKIFEKNDPSKVPISRNKKRPNFLYAVQSSSRPMEFKFFVSDPSLVEDAHLNYIENQLRRSLPLLGIPVKIVTRKSRKEK